MLEKAYIPYGGYFSSPFSRWQGTLANENSITLGAATAKRWLEQKHWDPKIIDYVYLGITVHQLAGFYPHQCRGPGHCKRLCHRQARPNP